ncbi:nickel-dependent hydrogenase, large subunit [Novosphingobium nitrogenifigens DSM 19370]|uniref:Nickel-dependent hydrogenase, large subunit n=1 Tax=Novosphingobium nitrogenifigens DSM 19370 TaxID=983920 RepID=F1Z465_9SPHN|nr:nickel-dependent hydrogenase large subunit [Novosphingobium nitrogenifigens]EGD60622.1 nickel-dependent hydrogenase, large subunit [Novosphingobium nitrogenifigens DSM 19370]
MSEPSRLIVGPFNRVEGDLEVRLDLAGDHVEAARVTSPLYRGFEAMLVGRPAMDALVYAPRICGICSVSQSVAAARALAGVRPTGLERRPLPANGAHATNLVHAVENLADHLTHFYLFFMPDFARATYAEEPWHAGAAERFTALKGTAAVQVLPARAGLMNLMGILAGKWPHTLSIQPGGSTRAITRAEQARLRLMIAGFRAFCETHLFAAPLEQVATLAHRDALYAWAEGSSGDFARFVMISRALDLARLGRTSLRHIAFGAYPSEDGPLFPRGMFDAGIGTAAHLPLSAITEDVSHAWYRGESGTPGKAAPVPDMGNPDAYSWCKAPRLDGRVAEVGALSRQLVAGHPLLRDMVAREGASVEARVVARVIEIALVTMAMEQWIAAIDPQAPFQDTSPRLETGDSMGLTEAARGSLGHWLRLDGGRITHYQIIAPTTWNFSPRDAAGTPGPLEQALVGAPIRPGETEPVAVQHVVRSFDPCMVCTVH